MNTSGSVIDAQVRHMLDVIERHRSAHCKQIQLQAEERAVTLISKAHQRARSKMHDDIDETRIKTRLQLASAEARLQTRKRLARQYTDKELLLANWTRLHDSLDRLWQQADTRRLWIDKLLAQALVTLVSPCWCIEHPFDWPEQERTALQAVLHGKLGQLPELTAVADISAGLRLCAEGSCVDGTAEGLMHERSRIESLMLAEIHKHA